jgi:hypothetical protein
MGYTYLCLGPLVGWALGRRTRRISSAMALLPSAVFGARKGNPLQLVRACFRNFESACRTSSAMALLPSAVFGARKGNPLQLVRACFRNFESASSFAFPKYSCNTSHLAPVLISPSRYGVDLHPLWTLRNDDDSHDGTLASPLSFKPPVFLHSPHPKPKPPRALP